MLSTSCTEAAAASRPAATTFAGRALAAVPALALPLGGVCAGELATPLGPCKQIRRGLGWRGTRFCPHKPTQSSRWGGRVNGRVPFHNGNTAQLHHSQMHVPPLPPQRCTSPGCRLHQARQCHAVGCSVPGAPMNLRLQLLE